MLNKNIFPLKDVVVFVLETHVKVMICMCVYAGGGDKNRRIHGEMIWLKGITVGTNVKLVLETNKSLVKNG